MSKVLIVGEQTGGVLGQAVGRAVACAKELNPAEVTVALFGAGDLGSAAQAAAALEGVTRVLVIEQNQSAQLYKYLRAECDRPGRATSLHRPGALQFSPGEIRRHLVEWSRA